MQQPSLASDGRHGDIEVSIADANTHAVRQAFSALNRNDFAALAAAFHREVAWYTPGRSPLAGETSGRNAVLARFARCASDTGETFRMKLKKVLHSRDGRVVAIHLDTGERNGKRLSAGCCTVYDFEDGLILEGRDHFFDLYNWDEFWS